MKRGIEITFLYNSNFEFYYKGNRTKDEFEYLALMVNIIKNYLNDKIKGLPGSIVFSKTFLSFSKDEKEAKRYLEYIDKNFLLYYLN